MICLGIESTAHTFGVGIINDKGKILANAKDSYTTEKGGIHPKEAKEHHLRVKDNVVEDALLKASISLKDINLISFSQGPGLAPCLIVGMEKAKELSRKLNVPLVGVNHCICHLEIGKLLTNAKDPVLLYVSGANTQVIAYEGGKYRIFGETLDNGVGNFIDAFARELGLGFPGGPKIYELALKGKNYIELPYCVKGMDISVGGILTNLKQKIKSGFNKEDLAYSCQETVFSMLVEVAERAMAHCGKNDLLLGGGVACNKRLQEMCKIMCKERTAEYYCPENSVLVDNGLMIAWQGILERKNAAKDLDKIDIRPYWRTDQVDVDWR
ncbi:MAG: bifunctional N(6)-L-threonylcarbamoyladenine synthase/serine/threonine protein kinase [Candidatus Woesearchaeota archaeon]|nr:bifunctional N(6)-L-threonylcarbamoyladenine synthase/serine/threonine protein kinase [Candidatus Woesearchaeota archaeon]